MPNPLEALKKAQTITATPQDQVISAQREWGEAHPILQGLADALTGGATNIDYEMGPADVLGAAIPPMKLGMLKHMREVQRADKPIEYLKELGARFLSRNLKPSEIDPAGMAFRQFMGERASDRRLTPMLKPTLPEGFETSAWPQRDPSIIEDFLRQREAETAQEIYTKRHGGSGYSSKIKSAKLTGGDVLTIRNLNNQGLSLNEIHEKFPHVGRDAIRGVIVGDTWSSLK